MSAIHGTVDHRSNMNPDRVASDTALSATPESGVADEALLAEGATRATCVRGGACPVRAASVAEALRGLL